jgi:glycosyltransferase involved in cell wall biosynthesis
MSGAAARRAPRLAFVYDHRYPDSVGGAERLYAALCARLARDQPVTYLTRGGARRSVEEGVEVRSLAPPPASGAPFARRTLDKARFALAVAVHLLLRGGRYDVVHVACFPNAVAIAAALALAPRRRTRLVVDWHEVLRREPWRQRLGRQGDAAWLVQRAAVRAGDLAIAFSRLHAERLRAEGRRGPVAIVPEFPPIPVVPGRAPAAARERLVVFVGRLVAEKRPELVPAALRELRRGDPGWRAVVFGDGPERERVAAAADAAGVADALRLAGFAPWEEVADALARGACLLAPTVREGFGLAVLEAAAHGLPAVLVAEPDNAAVELVEPGENGLVCDAADPATLARAVERLAADPEVHARTRAWFERAAERYSVEATVATLRALHERILGYRSPAGR